MPDPLDLDALEARYAEPVIPPCRVCGAPLEIHAIGGGKPTEYYCSAALANGRDEASWDHFSRSNYSDRRRGGDPDVIALIARARLTERMAEALKWTLEHHRAALASKPHVATHSISYAESVLSEWDALNEKGGPGADPE